jgi:hypothetical protein
MILPSYGLDFSAQPEFAYADEGSDEPQGASLDRWNRPGGVADQQNHHKSAPWVRMAPEVTIFF